MPHIPYVDPSSVTGRGLRIVESLVRSWDVRATPPGKTVSFELGWAAP